MATVAENPQTALELQCGHGWSGRKNLTATRGRLQRPMATRLENLETALDNIAAQIVDITENPKPDYSINGQSVSWSAHLNNLLNAQKILREQIQAEGGPVCAITQGVS